MKSAIKALVCAAVLVSMSLSAMAQLGYTVSDHDNASPQELIRFDVGSCGVENLGTINTLAEQEGLFSVGSILFGYSEYDPALADLEEAIPASRMLPPPNTNGGPLGPNPNRAICRNPAGAFGTESGAAYNPADGYVYVVNSDDTIPAGTIRSRFFKFKPGCQDFQEIGTGSLIAIDGLAIDAQGNGYASDMRQTDRIYRFNPATGSLTAMANALGPAIDSDSGLGWDFENDRLFLLLEQGPLYVVNVTGAGAGSGTLQCTVMFDDDMEGFDIPVTSPID